MKNPSLKEIIKLRALTGAGLQDAKKALIEAGSLTRALKLLRQRGAEISKEKGGRESRQGAVTAYVHLGGKVGALVEVSCETDFVARSDIFQQFASDLALQVVGMNPRYLSREEVPLGVLKKLKSKEKREQFFQEACLLEQPMIKTPEKKVADLLHEVILQIKENVKIRRFVRFEVGT